MTEEEMKKMIDCFVEDIFDSNNMESVKRDMLIMCKEVERDTRSKCVDAVYDLGRNMNKINRGISDA